MKDNLNPNVSAAGSKADHEPAPARSKFDTWKDVTAVIQSIATVVALIVGGFWTYTLFIEQRENLPHANISQNVIGKLVAPEWYWLETSIKIQNTGKTIISVGSADIRVQQILPLPKDILADIKQKKDPVPEHQMLVQWWGICRYVRSFSARIEPGETETTEAQFIIPAWLKTVRVYVHLANQTAQDNYGWFSSAIHDLKGDNANETESMAKLEPNTDRLCAFDE